MSTTTTQTSIEHLGPFRVHCSDPPWESEDDLPGERGAAHKYKCMKIDDIINMQTPLMMDNSALCLWHLTSSKEGDANSWHPRNALKVVEAWGFRPVSTFLWVKYQRCGACKGGGKKLKGKQVTLEYCQVCFGRGMRQKMNLGRSARNAHEQCIIAIRGRTAEVRRFADVPTVIHGIDPSDPDDGVVMADHEPILHARMPQDPSGKLVHSAKPIEFYQAVERLFAGPYVETFARERAESEVRPGWTYLGDQAPEQPHVPRFNARVS
jgi:N6-adenosine-specific RNA methylase IME4